MKQDELKAILDKHQKWLNDEDGGERADLHNIDLSDSDLRGSDLSDSDLRKCDLLDVTVDKRIFAQMAYHLCRVVVDDDECIAAPATATDTQNHDEPGRHEIL